MKREDMLARLASHPQPWDLVVIGGGATGMGVAVDGASRGFDVLLLEKEDFGKATSSRSTKLVHGGVRYLEQGNISLVMEALKERGIMRQNAPHLVHDLAFVVPNYSWWEAPFYGIGMKVYDLLAGKYGFGKSRSLSEEETLQRLPNLQRDGLLGGVIYYDGQFDDSRLLIHLAQTAADHGATLLNYAPVVELMKGGDGFISGVIAEDSESGKWYTIEARAVVNAAGIFVDSVRRMADARAPKMIAPSQGIHLVFDGSFLAGESAIMVPRTSDGRVLFAIPWHGHTLVGTTDTAIDEPIYDPLPLEEEIEFVLETAGQYLHHPPKRSDVLSVFVGIRPLVKADSATSTSALSRDHTIHIDQSGLLTIVGGKWTTYRHMAEDCVNQAITLGKLEDNPCVTRALKLHGYLEGIRPGDKYGVYGTDMDAIIAISNANPELGEELHPALPYTGAEVVWAVREEMARTLDDVLSRRTRALFLNAKAAIEMAPAAARIMAAEMGEGAEWVSAEVSKFQTFAKQYEV